MVKIDPSTPHRPAVRVLTGPEGEKVVPFERDLSKALSVVIIDVAEQGGSLETPN